MADDALESGIVDGVVAIGVTAGVVVVVVDVSSFLLQPASAARLNDSAAINVSDRM